MLNLSDIVSAGAVAALVASVWVLQPPRGKSASLPGNVPTGDSSAILQASGGPTRYRSSLGSGRLIVLIPGISYPMEVYDNMFKALVAAGRSVLVYDVTDCPRAATSL